MTDISDLTITVEIKQVWTWPRLGRALVVSSIDGTEHLMEYEL